jgi:hypothetical protein
VNDRNDDLSTADLAGQGAGAGTADERAVRGEPVDRTAERNDAFPGERTADADYADDRSGYAGDRADGLGGSPADRAAYADDDQAMATDRAGYGDARTGTELTGDQAVDNGRFAGDREVDGAPVDRGSTTTPTDSGAGTDTPVGTDTSVGTGTQVGTETPVGTGSAVGTGSSGTDAGPLLDTADTEGFRARWTDVQTSFVDAPRRSVEQADALVAELMQQLAKSFADERSRLESQWDRGEDIPTDDLRTAFQRYRSFFERLLST